MVEQDADVIVVGAGLSGLAAADEVRRLGRSALVLEARAEPGGRAHSGTACGAPVDFGGEWVGGAHRGMMRFVRELGVHVEPTRALGAPILWRFPDRQTCRRLPPPGVRGDLLRLYLRAVRDGSGLDPQQPWRARHAAELDAWSVAEWVDALSLGEESQHLLRCVLGSLVCQRLDRLSLLHFLWLLQLAGGPLRSLRTTFRWRITEGAQEVARRLAARLRGSLRMNAPVTRISQRDGEIAVAADREHRAANVVVAVPPLLLREIDFDPPLPPAQQDVAELSNGAGVKVIGLLPDGHRVRHNAVLGGDVLWNAWRNGRRVTGFAPGPALEGVPEQALHADLAGAFHVDPGRLRHVRTFRWAEQEHIRACDPAFAPGEVCRLGPALRSSHGRVRFAGAERSSWPNNMEGAVRSGLRAAHQAVEG